MPYTAEDFRKTYASMTEDDLKRIQLNSLGDIARECYEREVAYRKSPEYGDSQKRAKAELEAKETAEAQRCFFCGSESVSQSNAARVLMHSAVGRQRIPGYIKDEWQEKVVLVSRCAHCKRLHRIERAVRISAGFASIPISLILLFISAGYLSGRRDDGRILVILTPILWYSLLLLLPAVVVGSMYLFPPFLGTKSIGHAYKSLAIDRAMRDGWGKGAPLTFFRDYKRMFRKFVGLIESQ